MQPTQGYPGREEGTEVLGTMSRVAHWAIKRTEVQRGRRSTVWPDMSGDGRWAAPVCIRIEFPVTSVSTSSIAQG
jgi:hypothetical protein